MVVKDFIPLSGVKQTTEKAVQQKPSLAELTTVESPGKPSPANLLENDSIKKTRRKKTEKSEPSQVQAPQKDTILIITEKPQAAQKIAAALGQASKYTEQGVSYYELSHEGKKIVVASAVGHLFTLTYKKGQKGWPIFEVEWIPSYTTKTASFTKRYYELLKKLARRAKEIIIATDYDVEGEVIGWNVLRFICKEKDAKRMKYSTLTAPELQKSFAQPLQNLNWGNAYAGETRHILDWLYGINLSRALMAAIKKTGSFKLLSIGRVQGPVLKIIVDREREITTFVSKPYWQVFIQAQGIEFQHPEDIFDKKILDQFKDLKEAIASTKKSQQNLEPPVPFDLTTLQRETYRLYKINPSETLAISQKLYLDGIISYPRTSSQKIPQEIEPKKILKSLEKHFPEVKQATRAIPKEGQKTDPAHPSIYPTGEFKNLTGKEEKLYQLIAKRFIAAFSPDAITANKKITLIANGLPFAATGQEIIEKGWTSFYPITLEENKLPDLEGPVKIEKTKIEEKQTQPPHRYTPASLVTILEKKNLGTKATRSMIVETLFSRGYVEGTSIKATALGDQLIGALEKYSSIIIDENLNRKVEEEMEKMHSGGDLPKQEQEILEKAKKIIQDISKEFKAQETAIGQALAKGLEVHREQQNEANTLMPCPTCKSGNLRILYSKKTRRYFIACSNYPTCKQTYSLPPNALIKKAGKNCEADQFPKLLAIRKGRRPWEFCFNPQCPLEKAKREAWQAKKDAKQEK